MEGELQDNRGPGRNKRKWDHNEDSALVAALVDMVNCGLYKAENGFKPGYLNYLEEKLQVSLPTAGLKAKPHIESRIKVLKRDFCTVFDMVYGQNTSGFGIDPVTKCLTADKVVWDAYLQSHRKAAIWKTKAFPFWEELLDVFGKDRATGENAEGPVDAQEEIEREETENEVNNDAEVTINSGEDVTASQSFMNMQSPRSEEIPTRKKKKRSRSEDHLTAMMDGMQNAASVIGNEISKAAEVFSKAIGVDATISEKRQQIRDEVRKMSHLTHFEVIKIVCYIARDHELTDVFFTMSTEEREELCNAILVGDV